MTLALITAPALITAGQLPAWANEATVKATEVASITSGDGGAVPRLPHFTPVRQSFEYCD